MANIRPYKNKDGNIVSYHIEVYRGRDSLGKKLKPFTTSWRVPDTYKSEKAINRALDKFIGEFEASCKRGEVSTSKQTFGEYARYYIDLISIDAKKTSIQFYKSLLPLLDQYLGNIKLSDLTAEHINMFYKDLQTKNLRRDTKYKSTEKLQELNNEHGYSKTKVMELTGLGKNTITSVFSRRNVSPSTAQSIVKIYGVDIKDIFEPVYPDSTLSQKTIKHYHRFISTVLSNALTEGVVPRNVALSARIPKSSRHEADFFEIDEIIKIRFALDQEDIKHRIMIYLLCDTGIRRGELFGLRWKQVDFKNCTITINNNVQWVSGVGLYNDTTKNEECRTISVTEELMKQLKQYKKEQNSFKMLFGASGYNPEGYLFVHDDTGKVMHPSSLNKWLVRFEKRHDLPHIHPHMFRHSQASILYASGIDIVTISNRLGHKQVSTTQNIYAHMMHESDKKASDAIADALYNIK